jgi:hypothetical protein
MAKIKSYQEQVQDVVAKAIDAVEEQYNALAGASFGYAEKYYNVETVKTKHDEVVSLATGKARDVNKLVGSYAGDLIAKFEKEAPKKAAAKKPAAKKAAAKKPAAKKAPAKKAEAAATA